MFYRTLDEEATKRIIKQADKDFIADIMSKSVSNHLYGMRKEEERDWVKRLGFLIRKVLNIYSEADSPHHAGLKRMFEEQYKVAEQVDGQDHLNDSQGHTKDPEVSPKAAAKISSNSMQSIHDPDASYRIKGHGSHQQKICGYSSNITEMVGEEINLITDVLLEKATHSDDAYLLPAMKHTEHITGSSVKSVYTDGAYDSYSNRLALKELG